MSVVKKPADTCSKNVNTTENAMNLSKYIEFISTTDKNTHNNNKVLLGKTHRLNMYMKR